MELFSKKELSEADIKRKYITPAIEKKWNPDHIRMEAKITDGKINLKGNHVVRERCKYADYLLYLNNGKPIAVVEAKDNNHLVSEGLDQAKKYALMMDIQFIYSSNGDAFCEWDLITGKRRKFNLDEFPTQEELIARYYAERKDKSGLTDDERKVIEQDYYSSQNTYVPRYYQTTAVNRTVEAIARGQERLLLVMATGTGKTYVAFQIAYRLLKAGLKKRILYLTDRNILVDQSILQDFAPLEKTIYKVNFSDKECLNQILSHEVNFALYQQMVGLDDTEHFRKIPKDYFDLIIVDECHRGSAKEDSNWRRVLKYFSSATQIGMTATPKESADVSNIDYFGDPVYTYSLKQGIEDGFLAPFKVINVTLDISDGWRPYKGQKDIFGNEIEDRIYNNRDYDYPNGVIIKDRICAVAKVITKHLRKTDRMQKTIVFCATEDAAERMKNALMELNTDMVRENPDYVVRITGSDDYGKSKLAYFISTNEKYPVIATTSELLSTGADCKTTKLIVLDKYIESMITFKQIIGRGTRIREDKGKMHFTVMDFRGVTSLFADPEWDGPVEQSDEFVRGGDEYTPKEYRPPAEKLDIPTVDREGCRVKVVNEMVSVYDVDGKILRQVDIIDYTKTNIAGEYASLSDFINKWNSLDKKEEIRKALETMGIDLEKLKRDQNLADVDDFDFICHIVYGKKPLTRAERARNVKKKDFFSKYSGDARAVLEILLDKYMDGGIIEMENIRILSMKDFAEFGKPAKIVKLFGGKEGYEQALRELEDNIYGVEAV